MYANRINFTKTVYNFMPLGSAPLSILPASFTQPNDVC